MFPALFKGRCSDSVGPPWGPRAAVLLSGLGTPVCDCAVAGGLVCLVHFGLVVFFMLSKCMLQVVLTGSQWYCIVQLYYIYQMLCTLDDRFWF